MTATSGPNLGQIEYEALGAEWYEPLKSLLRAIDGLVQCAVLDKDLSAPPGSTPANGARYIVGASPTGAWSGHAGHIARWTTSDGAARWEFYPPSAGWLAYVGDETTFYRFDSTWAKLFDLSGYVTSAALSDAIAAALAAALDDYATTAAVTTAIGAGLATQAEVLMFAVSDETTAITTGTAKVTFRMPWAFTLSAVRASLTTASSSGPPTFDINENGTSILSTKLTIDASERTSTTAAAAAVISDVALADDAEITVDIDVAGTGAKGAKVYLIGTRA